MNVYVSKTDKKKLLRKAKRLGLSLSRLMVQAALQFDIVEGDEKNARK
jgi:hypothetical protein